MEAFFIFVLMLTYAAGLLFHIGGQYVHVLPAMAFIIYLYSLFNAGSAGVASD